MVVASVLFLLAAVTLREDAPLKAGCEPGDPVIAVLKAGEPARIRFSLAGSATPCYKVATSAGVGYVYGNQLDGLDQFLAARDSASSNIDSIKVTRVEVDTVGRRAAAAVAANGTLAGASRLIETNQPQAALASLEPELRIPHPDPNALVLAGVAAWRGDDPKRALGYWKTALDLRPDPTLQKLYDKVQRETLGDRSGQKSIGMRITLRYEGEAVSPETAREMLNALDSEWARLSEQLGCRAEERITAVVQSREAYLKTTGAAEWAGGQYDGRIRIALIDGERAIGPRTRRVFAHELVHACLTTFGNWPSWFQEGVAQKLSGDQLPPQAQQKIEQLVKTHAVPKLENLGQNWSRMSGEMAAVAYALSLRAADLLWENHSGSGLRNLLNNPSQLPAVTAELDRRLGL